MQKVASSSLVSRSGSRLWSRLGTFFFILTICSAGTSAEASEAFPVSFSVSETPIVEFARVVEVQVAALALTFKVDPDITDKTVTAQHMARPWDMALTDTLGSVGCGAVRLDDVVVVSTSLKIRDFVASNRDSIQPLSPGAGEERRYSGARIDSRYRRSDLVTALTKTIPGTMRVKVAPNVYGLVTLTMENSPWDQVLDVLTVMYGLRVVREGNSITISQRGGSVPTLPPLDHETTPKPSSREYGNDSSAARKSRFTGKTISLNFKNQDFLAAMEHFSRETGFNLVVHPKVKGKPISLFLTDVPWDQALDIIIRTQGLRYEVEGTVINILPANPGD